MFSLASSPPHIQTPAPLALFVRFARRSDVGAFRAEGKRFASPGPRHAVIARLWIAG